MGVEAYKNRRKEEISCDKNNDKDISWNNSQMSLMFFEFIFLYLKVKIKKKNI